MANEWWKYALGALGGPIGLGAVALGENADFTGYGEKEREFNESQKRLAEERQKAKQAQLTALGGIQAPQQNEATKRRIQMLEQEGQNVLNAPEVPLSQNPEFQAQRARLVSGGASALAGVQNREGATGAKGGFSNIGNAQDIYDRLGTQLASLGGQAYQNTQAKRAQAEGRLAESANMQQAFTDATTQFQNAQTRARAAIESGDSAAAMQAITDALNFKNQAIEADRKLKGAILGGVLQGGAAALGGALGGPMGAQMGGQMGGSVGKGFGAMGEPSLGVPGAGGGGSASDYFGLQSPSSLYSEATNLGGSPMMTYNRYSRPYSLLKQGG